MAAKRPDSHIAITSDLGRAVGGVAKEHPDCAIFIDWYDCFGEDEWVLTADNGEDEWKYFANDQSGDYVRAGQDILDMIGAPA